MTSTLEQVVPSVFSYLTESGYRKTAKALKSESKVPVTQAGDPVPLEEALCYWQTKNPVTAKKAEESSSSSDSSDDENEQNKKRSALQNGELPANKRMKTETNSDSSDSDSSSDDDSDDEKPAAKPMDDSDSSSDDDSDDEK
eukprot:CAMPEP_0185769640 /NCGR_PEP_ID=MMETSP1174-20130828/55142_1 /TAXON_ID=35687 /ORGANISM="Dictyocha speculum, Strain CCMP1381" /LENGTH=141 /DNA_ID=CAMNT_0028454787 /DNA_START=22 /DNA_END=444 /DNA_ORIENTATION=+